MTVHSIHCWIRYVRVMGLKEEMVQATGFQRLAVFRPGIIAGNAHTPRYVAWLGRLIPGRFGTIEQDDIGRAFVAEFVSSPAPNGVVYFENGAMRQRAGRVSERNQPAWSLIHPGYACSIRCKRLFSLHRVGGGLASNMRSVMKRADRNMISDVVDA